MLLEHHDESEGLTHDARIVGTPRVVRDLRSGDLITVSERRADGIAGARGPTCLIFSTDRGFIRLWEYPATWSAMSDGELVILSEFRRATRSLHAAHARRAREAASLPRSA